MRSLRKIVAGAVSVGFLAGSMLPANAIVVSGKIAGFERVASRFKVSDVPRSIFPIRDFGRKPGRSIVSATVMMRYNHQPELNALVASQANRRSPLYHHFLTSAQFNNYFAPTPLQQNVVISALKAAGISVKRTYANRTLINLEGPSESFERFFDTEIHSFLQGRYGARFANVRPATVPTDLAPIVASVNLSNFVVAKTGPKVRSQGLSRPDQALMLARKAVNDGQIIPPAYTAPHVYSQGTNVVLNPGFEGNGGWHRCETRHAEPVAEIVIGVRHTGKKSAKAGSTSSRSGEQYGYSGVCQLVSVPSHAILSAYLYSLSNEPSTTYAAQDVLLLNTKGGIIATLARSVLHRTPWILHSWNLSAYSGKQIYIYFGVHGDGYKSAYTVQYVDDVSLIGAVAPTPPPTPTPPPAPTPVPTPMPPAVCNATPDNGPLNNGYGYMPTGVAKAFDFPVQHGCNGAGQTVAVVIDSIVEQQDVSTYMNASGITQFGSLTNVAPIPGYNATYSPGSDGTNEGTLDVETIFGLAPGVNVRVYGIQELSDYLIEDAYNAIISDDIATIVNSSFGGCELQDPGFSEDTNALAEQGAALGITFVASSGDAGSDECATGNKPPAAAAPAIDPFFVGLGGVNFSENDDGELTTLSAIGDGNFQSGGGVSTLYALPAYQSMAPGINLSGRNSPDLSLPGVDVPIYYFYSNADVLVDGTSWASPQFVALLSEANEMNMLQHGSGFINPAMYAIFAQSGYTDFSDIAFGSNGAYNAVAGYDLVTGIGAPKGFPFALSLGAQPPAPLPIPVPTPLPTQTPNPLSQLSRAIYVADFSGNRILEYAPGATGSAAAVAVISGGATCINQPTGIALDTAGVIYISNAQSNQSLQCAGPPPTNGSGSVVTFAGGSNGNVPPLTTINLSVGFQPVGIALDANSNIYLGLGQNSQEEGYKIAADSNGLVTPLATYTQNCGGCGFAPLTVTPQGTVLIHDIGFSGYSSNATGSVDRSSSFNSGSIPFPAGMAIDPSGRVAITTTASSGGTYGAQPAAVRFFSAASSGLVSPVATIDGSSTGLVNPSGIAFDATGFLYVLNSQTAGTPCSIIVFAPNAVGNVAPIANIPSACGSGLAVAP